MYFTEDDGTTTMKRIDSVDTNTGQVDLSNMDNASLEEFLVTPMKVWNSGQYNYVNIYPVTSDMLWAFLDRSGWITTGQFMNQGIANNISSSLDDFMIYTDIGTTGETRYAHIQTGGGNNDNYLDRLNFQADLTNELVEDGLGSHYAGTIGADVQGNILDIPVDFYEFEDDVPQLPDCFDGIMNQDETGIDCGGVCLQNFGFECPPAETCFDGIMNQDETGIDYGGVCGTGSPVITPSDPENFVDVNQDGIDDMSGVDSTGAIPVGTVSGSFGAPNSNTYDASLPGDLSEIGETNWTGLITDFLAANPLVAMASGSSINLSGETCQITGTIWGSAISIDFCPLAWMVDIFGTFLLAIMAIRSVFIALGV